MKKKPLILGGIGIGMAISLSFFLFPQDDFFPDIHGIGFDSKGTLWVGVHDGLRQYDGGEWKKGEEEPHDYMGFSVVDNGFYSSGHPAPHSSFANPLGVVKGDFKKGEVEVLALHGEVDYHDMGAGYVTHTLYVKNYEANSKMKTFGLYHSEDEGKTWKRSLLKGFKGEPQLLAVHPTEKGTVALLKGKQIYLSMDYGDNFTLVYDAGDEEITTLSFDHQGRFLIGTIHPSPSLHLLRVDPHTQAKDEILLPSITHDYLAYVVQHPEKEGTFVIATRERDLYFTSNGGETWEQIAKKGKKP